MAERLGWRKWAEGTTNRQGRERDLEDYEGFLGFKREELEGKSVLDLGSGETELFARELQVAGVQADVVTINPDYRDNRFRTAARDSGGGRRAVAALGQELPFRDRIFDRVFGLWSVTAFASPESSLATNQDKALRWAAEVSRMLKPGGEARLAPVISEDKYGAVINQLRSQGFDVSVEPIMSKEIGLSADYPEEGVYKRLIIRKPLNNRPET